VVAHIAEGFLIVLLFMLSLSAIVMMAAGIFVWVEYIFGGIIETYKQADTIYLDSLSKKDTVIEINN
jgi:hypothetical protein